MNSKSGLVQRVQLSDCCVNGGYTPANKCLCKWNCLSFQSVMCFLFTQQFHDIWVQMLVIIHSFTASLSPGSIVYLGMMFGAFFWGGLSDKLGRKQCLLISMSVNGFFAFLSSFVQGYSMFLVCRMVSGFGWVYLNLPLFFFSSLLLNILLLYIMSSSVWLRDRSLSEDVSPLGLMCPPTVSSAIFPPPKSKHMTRGYCNCLAPAHPHPLSYKGGGLQRKTKTFAEMSRAQ